MDKLEEGLRVKASSFTDSLRLLETIAAIGEIILAGKEPNGIVIGYDLRRDEFKLSVKPMNENTSQLFFGMNGSTSEITAAVTGVKALSSFLREVCKGKSGNIEFIPTPDLVPGKARFSVHLNLDKAGSDV